MKILLLVSALLFSSLVLLSCKKNNPIPPEEQPRADLTLEDVSCTEAWLKLSTGNIALPVNVELLKDDSLNLTVNLTTSDTVLYIDSLLPDQTYSFHTIIQPSNHTGEITSVPLTVTTLDTTSHNFTWQTWTFGGQAGSCTLYDVAIINENNIWAVGAIYLLDSLGQYDPNAYNSVHWDGNQWKLKRVYFPSVCGSTSQSSFPAKAIFAFVDGQIWISSSGDKMAILQNGVQIDKFCLQWSYSINKIWGTSSNDLYVVGSNGNIVHYQNSLWHRVVSGTDLTIYDIYGAYNNKLNDWEILAIASNGWEEKVLKISNDEASFLQDNGLAKDIHGVWFVSGRHYYIVGAGIHQKHLLTDTIWKVYPPGYVTNYYSGCVAGNGINDLFVTGAFFEVVHFNGANWTSYRNVFPAENGSFGRVAIKSDLVVLVGFKDQQAIIAMGKRQI